MLRKECEGGDRVCAHLLVVIRQPPQQHRRCRCECSFLISISPYPRPPKHPERERDRQREREKEREREAHTHTHTDADTKHTHTQRERERERESWTCETSIGRLQVHTRRPSVSAYTCTYTYIRGAASAMSECRVDLLEDNAFSY